MKKQLIVGLVAAALTVAGSAMANGTPAPKQVAEGVEISGNVTIITGYQHDGANAVVPTTAGYGGLGDVRGIANNTDANSRAGSDTFLFAVDQVELDLQKSFGENIRLRADIDFVDLNNTAHRAGDFLDLEQAYVTANIGWGNGVEFLIGKFNAPVGVDSVDRNENWLISYASPFRYVTPTNITGAKIYYAFSDLIDLHFYVVNDLNGAAFGDSSPIPSFGGRLGFNWGSEEKKNTIGLSGGAGPESVSTTGAGVGGSMAHWDFFGDIDLMIAASDTVTVAAEAVYRQTNSSTGSSVGGPGANQKIWAGFAAVNIQASDAWDVTLRGDMAYNPNPAGARGSSGTSLGNTTWLGYEGTLISGTVGAGYKIAEGAKMKMEYRFDDALVSGPAQNSTYHSVMAEFAYTF